MTWKYDQESGDLYLNDKFVSSGYSGAGDGKNNPAMQDVHNVGPIPRGEYEIGSPSDTKTHGPYVLHLTPAETNDMHGRSGFLIHGDSVVHPGTASEGCIILPRTVRERIWESGDIALTVT